MNRSKSPYGGATGSDLSDLLDDLTLGPVQASQDNTAVQNKSRSQSPHRGVTCLDLSYLSEDVSSDPIEASQDNTTAQNKSSLLPLPPDTRHQEGYIQKVIQKFDFIQDCLYELVESFGWKSLIQPHHMHHIEDLGGYDFRKVHSIFMESNAKSSNFEIIKIKKNCNPFLLISYHLTKSNYIKEYGWVNEIALFHGTTSSRSDSICANNFDWRMTGNSTGHKFGQGVSFSPDSYYASHYGYDFMILSNVLVARTSIGDCTTIVPPDGTDTTTNLNKSVYVKYEDNTFLPQYIIQYT